MAIFYSKQFCLKRYKYCQCNQLINGYKPYHHDLLQGGGHQWCLCPGLQLHRHNNRESGYSTWHDLRQCQCLFRYKQHEYYDDGINGSHSVAVINRQQYLQRHHRSDLSDLHSHQPDGHKILQSHRQERGLRIHYQFSRNCYGQSGIHRRNSHWRWCSLYRHQQYRTDFERQCR